MVTERSKSGRKRAAETAKSLIPELLTFVQAQARYGIGARTLLNWHKAGILEARLAGRTLVTSPAAVEHAITLSPARGRPRKPVNSEASDNHI